MNEIQSVIHALEKAELDEYNMIRITGEARCDIVAVLKEQPEVIRCKDCRFCPTDIDARQYNDKRYVFCDKGEWHREDFFCADGKKRI